MSATPDIAALIYTTWPDKASVEAAAAVLLEEKLIACANILGPSTSIYRWEGKVETSQESIALFKTTSACADRLRDRLMELHPYDEPAILNLGISKAGSAPSFLSWIASEVEK